MDIIITYVKNLTQPWFSDGRLRLRGHWHELGIGEGRKHGH